MSAALDQAIRTNMLAFAMKAFAYLNRGDQLEPHPYVRVLADRLDQVADGEIRRLVVALPPRHLKTFLASVCLAAWVLAHRPSAKILILSYGQDLADKIAFQIREILRSDWFRSLFTTRIAKSRAKLMDFVTTAGGGVRSIGLEGGVTGVGADLIIIDDPLQIKDAHNERQLDRVNELFDSEIRTRLNHPKRGAIVVVAHRLAEQDLPGHVLLEGGWTELTLPFEAPRKRTYRFGNSEVWERKKGELLRPDAFTEREIARLRRMKGPGFETLHQQNPGAGKALRIKADHFTRFDPRIVPDDVTVVLSVEPGQKIGPTNSFGVIQAWGYLANALLLLEQWRDRARYIDFRHQVRRFIARHRPSVVLVEDTNQGTALMSELTVQKGMEIVGVVPREDKATRLRKHRHLIRKGTLALPTVAPWLQEFIDEITLFPASDFTDQVDALTQFLDFASNNPIPAKRSSRALIEVVDSRGRTIPHFRLAPAGHGNGIVRAQRPPFRFR